MLSMVKSRNVLKSHGTRFLVEGGCVIDFAKYSALYSATLIIGHTAFLCRHALI